MTRRFCNFAFLVSMLLGHGLSAKVIFVDDNASEGGDGSSWATAQKHLQDALADAESGDEVWVAEGTYKPDQGVGMTAGDREASFNLVSGVMMYGGFSGTETTRDPQGDKNRTILSGEIDDNSSLCSLHIVSVTNPSANDLYTAELVQVEGFHFSGGNANGEGSLYFDVGAAVFLRNIKIAFNDCSFTQSVSFGDGGSISSWNSDVNFTKCTFTNNNSKTNGGAVDLAGTVATFDFCHFESNKASHGGAISINSNSFLAIKNTSLENNTAQQGGAISGGASNINITNSIFRKNSATVNTGGAISLGMIRTESYITNCIFIENNSSNGGGAIYENSNDAGLVISQSSFLKNITLVRGGASFFYIDSGEGPLIHNSIFWDNEFDGVSSHGIMLQKTLHTGETVRFYNPGTTSVVVKEEVVSRYPGDPLASPALYHWEYELFGEGISILNQDSLNEGITDDIIRLNPNFVNVDDPIGPDGIWFTADDGLRLQEGSPAIDAGYNDVLPSDSSDLDGDGNTGEQIPYDIAGFRRIQGDKIDIGPYEYGDSRIATHSLSTSVSPLDSGSLFGGNLFIEHNNDTIIRANPATGYLFSNWSGNASGSTNPLAVTMDTDKSITANFIQDSNDDDRDGLTNYQELVEYGTDPNDSDSDNDGIEDAKEIEIGSNPKNSDAAVLKFGKTLVTSNPTSYSLVTQSLYDQALLDAKVASKSEGIAEGKSLVTSNPTSYSLVTQSEYNQAIESAKKTAREEASKDFQDIFQNQDSNSSPYTPDWFYIPERGWMWTNNKVFPWFHDANSSNWMYFKSGQDKPTFYHNGTKGWMALE